MSVQVVAAKMAEVDLKDVPTGKDLPAGSPMTPTSEGKNLARNEPHEAGSSAAASPTAEPSANAGDGSLGLLTPNPAKMPQASAMKRPDAQQNGGDAFVNRDGTVAEAPRMKKVGPDVKLFQISDEFHCDTRRLGLYISTFWQVQDDTSSLEEEKESNKQGLQAAQLAATHCCKKLSTLKVIRVLTLTSPLLLAFDIRRPLNFLTLF